VVDVDAEEDHDVAATTLAALPMAK
jgi:hypothetical protein